MCTKISSLRTQTVNITLKHCPEVDLDLDNQNCFEDEISLIKYDISLDDT